MCSCTKNNIKPKYGIGSYSTDADYLKVIDSRLGKITTFQGSGKLRISNSKKSDSATGVIIIKKPDSIRLESFSAFFGRAIFFFVSKADTFSIYIPNENKYFFGKNTLSNISKALPLDISISDFSSYMLGEFKRGEHDNVVVKFLEETNTYKIYFYGEDSQTVLWFDPEFSVVTKCVVYDSNEDVQTIVTYAKFKETNDIIMPMEISIKFPYLDAKIDIEYDEITINDSVRNELFNLEAPESALQIDLDSEKVMIDEKSVH